MICIQFIYYLFKLRGDLYSNK